MLKGLFGLFSNEKNEGEEDAFEEESGFVWNEHMRIVLAICVAIAAALFMWWIVA